MALNVNRSISDPFYRYKMPRLLAKVEGKGNGIKTVIANMTDIAKSLERPPTYPTKYFGCELGAQTQVDTKNDRFIVNGDHDANKLQDILDGFIRKFVLCPACENPETTMTVKRNQINSKCRACGHAFVIDPKHKLSTFIVKNPPKIEIDFSAVKDKKGSGATNEATPATGDVEVVDKNNSSSDDVDDDDDWAPEPVEGEQLASGIGKLVISKDLEKSTEERLDMLHTFFLEKKKNDQIGDGKVMADEAERLELKQKAPLLLADVLFNENILKDKQIENNRRLLLRFTLNDQKAQRYLLGGVEQLIVKHEEALFAKAAHIIKALYDTDICEEEALIAWGEKPSSKYVSKSQAKKIIEKCEPVLTWLKEAEEDTEEDSEDDAIEFDERTGKQSVFKAKADAEAAIKAEQKVEEGDDLDIDDI